jgi:hypothetical protein
MGIEVSVPAIPWDSEVPRIPEGLARAIWNEAGKRRRTESRADGQPIAEGNRNNALASLAGSMRRRGMSQSAIQAALAQVNDEQCRPPLDDGDVRRIAQSVCRYEADDPVVKLFEKGQRDPVYDEEGKLEHRLQVMPLADLYAKEEPGYQPLLGPLVMRGLRTIIGARTGEGKTTFVMHMVKSIVFGQEFLDYDGLGPDAEGRRPQVLIIDAEQSLPDVQRLAEECDLTESKDVHYIMAPDGLDLAEGSHDAAEIEEILDELKPDVLVLDPLYKSHRGDSNDEREAVDFMRLLDRWRATYGFALILPVHTRKGSKQLPDSIPTMDDIFGSGAFARGAEIIFGLQQTNPDTGYCKLHVWKHRPGWLTRSSIDMVFKRDEGYRRTAAEENKSLHTTEQRIITVLLERGNGLTGQEIIMELGGDLSIGAIRSAVSRSGKIWSAKDTDSKRLVRYYTERPSRGEDTLPDTISDAELERAKNLSMEDLASG